MYYVCTHTMYANSGLGLWVPRSPGGPGSTEYSVPGDIEKGVDKGGGARGAEAPYLIILLYLVF